VANAFALSAVAGSAFAQQPLDIDSPTPSPPAPAGTEQAVVTRYWELGRPRLFFGTTLEAGYAYARPRFTVGYGRPYWSWIGIETYPLVSLGGLGHYVGLGAALPGITARVGGRYSYPFSDHYLPPQATYTRIDVERARGPRADYLALEAELAATLPVLVGSAFAVVGGYRIELAPDGYYLYEESLRAVMKPPHIWRGRLGYLVGFGRDGGIRVGVASDVIGLPGRDEFIVRAGVLGSVLINSRLEAQVSLIPVIVSPDTLGLAGGDFGQLGVRFRWATGDTPDPARVREALTNKLRRQRAPRPEWRPFLPPPY
jgi:hypothetical protein